MQPPMGSTGPASPPTANPGLQADASSKIREAVHLLEMALPNLPTGSEQHKAAIDSLSKLSKAFPATEEQPGIQKTQLLGLAQRAQQQAMLQQVMRQAQSAQPQPGAGGPSPDAGGGQAPMAA